MKLAGSATTAGWLSTQGSESVIAATSPTPLQPRSVRTSGISSAAGLAILLGGLTAWTSSAAAQFALIRMAPHAGEIAIGLDSNTNQYGSGLHSANTRYRQWLRLPFSGEILGPDFFSYGLNVRPSFSQGRSSLSSQHDIDIRDVDVQFSSRILAGKPLSFTLSASQIASSATQAKTPLREFRYSDLEAFARYAFRPFPMLFHYSKRVSRKEWEERPFADNRLDAYRRDVLRLEGQSSKTRASLEYTVFDDFMANRDFASLTTQLSHVLRWGKGSGLSTNLTTIDRTTTDPYRHLSIGARLHLQHLTHMSSDWQYRRLRDRINGQQSVNTSYASGVSHSPTYWLGWGLRGMQQTVEARTHARILTSINPSLRLRATLPGDVRAQASGNLGLENRTHKGDMGSSVDVINERHEVEADRVIALENINVAEQSITVRSVDEVVLYDIDSDYLIEMIGQFAYLRIPVTSRIQEGDRVLVTYLFVPPALPDKRSVTASYDLALRKDGWRLHFRQALRNTEAEFEGLRFAETYFRDSKLDLTYNRRSRVGYLHLEAGWFHRETTTLDNTVYQLSGTLAPEYGGRVRSSVGGGWTHRTGMDASLTTLNGFATLHLSVTPAVRVDLRGEAFHLRHLSDWSESILSAFLDLSWRFGLVETQVRSQQVHRRAVESGSENRVSAQIVRRF